jgi:hypothetical protein
VNKSAQAEDMLQDFAVAVGAASINDAIILPGSGVTIKATAEELFRRIAPTKTMFIRGGAVMGVVENEGMSALEVIGPAAARSRFESYAKFVVYRAGRDGQLVLKPAIIPQDMAMALLESEEARTFLPPITGLINCPVIVSASDGIQIVGPGYHIGTGLFITGGQTPLQVDLSEAIAALRELVREFDFQSPGDRSRAMASFITPSLKLGGHLHGNVPADIAEADQSQSGKTYRQKLVAAVYNETPSLVTHRKGAVGSVDETLNEKLIAGRPFIQLDNFRGRFDSQHIEALLTAEKSFPVRVPHCREVSIDPRRFFVMLTSNGVETTRDFANRGSIIRIHKCERHTFIQYPDPGGDPLKYVDILERVRTCQRDYLGAVFAIVQRWIEVGRPRSDETRHDFREWVQTLDWIVQNILGEAPLMDGHQAAQERVSNPDLTFLRKLALAVADQDRLRESLNASALYEISDSADVDIPRLREPDEDKGKRLIGSIMARLFKTANSLTLDGFTVTRHEAETERHDGGGTYTARTYQFERAPQ